MERLTVGAIVLINFPFADLKGYKKRPALVVALSSLGTVVLCQITSRKLPKVPAVAITKNDFSSGGLPIASYARTDKLFTVDSGTAEKNVLGQLNNEKISVIKAQIRQLFA